MLAKIHSGKGKSGFFKIFILKCPECNVVCFLLILNTFLSWHFSIAGNTDADLQTPVDVESLSSAAPDFDQVNQKSGLDEFLKPGLEGLSSFIVCPLCAENG